MRELILLLLVGMAGYGAAQYPQGHDVSFYFWSCSVSGRLEDGRCCDRSGYTNCPDHCDVHFFLCLREHSETSNYCNEETSSHVTVFDYAYIDVHNITFFEGDNVFGAGLHNPLVYAFSGTWSRRIQTALVARDYDYDDSTGTSDFEWIDNIVYDWTVPAGRDTEMLTATGEFGNLIAHIGLRIDCWEGWYGDYCSIHCVARDDIEGHYTCNQDGTKECLEHWSGVHCTFSSTLCYPPCPVNRACSSGACSLCTEGYGGENCTCEDTNICDPSGGHCYVPCVNGGVCEGGACACPMFYTGESCSDTVDVCDSVVAPSECPEGMGTCVNRPDTTRGFLCSCLPGYSGEACDTNINDCVGSPCGENGECIDLVNSYKCDCNTGFTGAVCQEDRDECAASPCLNGGACQDGANAYTCSCPAGFVAPICQPEEACDRSSCSEHGECEVDASSQSAVCSCDNGYTGEHCETLVNNCDPNPCASGTLCQNGIGFHICCDTIGSCQNAGTSAVGGEVPFTQIAIIAVAMGVMVGILATVVIVVMVAACCVARRRKSNRVLSHGDTGAVEGPAAFSNPIYEGNLPTYEEIGGCILQEKKVLPYEEPAYEAMSDMKSDLSAYMHGNRGFVSAEEEKRELGNKYS